MEKAIWNGKEIFAFDTAVDYETEKAVRRASSNGELRCPDENCEHRVLKYCHGDKKNAYFAHLHNSNCEYEKYDNETEDCVKNIKIALFKHFCDLGYNVKMDQKIIEHYYSHIVIYQKNGIPYPIHIITKFSGFKKIMDIYDEFKNRGIITNWIVVDANFGEGFYAENELNFAKRFSLNEGNDDVLITIDLLGRQVAQYRMDDNSYVFDGRYCLTSDYPGVFQKLGTVNELVFRNGVISINEFDDDFNEYVSLKKAKFDETVDKIKKEKEAKRIREEKIAKLKAKRFNENLIKCADRDKENCKKHSVDLSKVKQLISELEIPKYNPNTSIDFSVWKEEDFIANLKSVANDVSTYYKLILCRVRYNISDRKILLENLYNRRDEFGEIVSFSIEEIYSQLIKDGIIK